MDDDAVVAGLVFLALFVCACLGATFVAAWIGWVCFGLLGVGALLYLAAP